MTSTLMAVDGPLAASKMYPQLILFGDSITQSAHGALIPKLSEWYLRRLDVVNRGFSGYTAPRGLELLPQFFPNEPPSSSTATVRLMTVFFGANDACLPGNPQHVPVEEYKDALRQIAGYEGLRLHETKTIFIAPGPVDEHQITDGQRTAANTAIYAAACCEIAADLSLPVLDLWTIVMKQAGWEPGDPLDKLIGSIDAPKSKVLAELLVDGLHLSDKGYSIVYDELTQLIRDKLPDEAAENVPIVFPDWQDVLGARR